MYIIVVAENAVWYLFGFRLSEGETWLQSFMFCLSSVISTARVFHVKQLYSHIQNLYGGYCVYFHFSLFMLECFF